MEADRIMYMMMATMLFIPTFSTMCAVSSIAWRISVSGLTISVTERRLP